MRTALLWPGQKFALTKCVIGLFLPMRRSRNSAGDIATTTTRGDPSGHAQVALGLP